MNLPMQNKSWEYLMRNNGNYHCNQSNRRYEKLMSLDGAVDHFLFNFPLTLQPTRMNHFDSSYLIHYLIHPWDTN